MGGIHFGKIDKSPRLQRVLGVLRDGLPHTTRDIMVRADVCAVNSCTAELRAQGLDIQCVKKAADRFEYTLLPG